MNREIKFRAWDKKRLRMAQVGSLEITDPIEGRPGVHVFIDGEGWWVDEWGFELMQFTGFKDKNGKDIYEGDILENSEYKDEIVKVEFFAGTWVAIIPGEHIMTLSNIAEHFEVIGNIFEHPELLNK